jgi:hypothetical protein
MREEERFAREFVRKGSGNGIGEGLEAQRAFN